MISPSCRGRKGKIALTSIIHVRNVEEGLLIVGLVNNDCDRCGREIEGTRLIFFEVDRQDRKHRFGIFCIQCSIELLDKLKGKLEWFHTESGWKGYVRLEARSKLERDGLIHPKHNTQSIEITQVGRKRGKIGRTEVLEILSEICQRTDIKGRI